MSTSSPRRKVLILNGIFLIPTLLCWGIAYGAARSEDEAFASGVDGTGTVAEVLEDRVRFNGRNSEDVTEVKISYTPPGGAAVVATVTVWSASGLTPGMSVPIRYLPAEPQKVLLRSGFWNRSSLFAFLTLFGGFWLVLNLALAAFLLAMLRKRGRG